MNSLQPQRGFALYVRWTNGVQRIAGYFATRHEASKHADKLLTIGYTECTFTVVEVGV